MEITQHDIYTYRDIYYGHVKPMMLARKSDIEINKCLEYICEEFNITVQRYKDLFTLDLCQRLARVNNPRIKVKGIKDYKESTNLPELRCPIRSEDKGT